MIFDSVASDNEKEKNTNYCVYLKPLSYLSGGSDVGRKLVK